jgi:putative flavoprotein involved in K+ transport
VAQEVVLDNSAASAETASEPLDVLIIGAGQAGLVMGYELKQRGLDFAIIDAASDVGDSWRKRWTSLKLFTAAQYNHLPGKEFPAAADTYPGKDDVAVFLRDYANEYELPVRLNTKVTGLTRSDEGYVAETSGGKIAGKQVVVATGPFQEPFIPAMAPELDARVAQLHSVEYRDPETLPDGRVLIVGGANTGCQIAFELSASRDVDIAVGERLPTLPQRPLGRDVWWWLTKLGVTRITLDSKLGQRMSERDVVIGGGLKELKAHGVTVRPRATGASNGSVRFEDGATGDYDVVIWATGFRVDHLWIDIPDLKDDNNSVKHVRGITSSPGLYLLGMTWQHKRTSALLGWVAEDAAFLAEQIASTHGSRAPAEAAAKRAKRTGGTE